VDKIAKRFTTVLVDWGCEGNFLEVIKYSVQIPLEPGLKFLVMMMQAGQIL